jgi:putative DNA primase/helicase
MAVLFANTKSIYPKRFASSWEQLKELLSFHEENAVKDAGALWSPVEYDPGTTRGNRNVRFVEALVVDMDGEAFDHAQLDGLEWFAYSTYSHRLDDPHYHLVLPLAEKVPASLWRVVWQELHDRIGLVGDPQTKDAARIFYLPQHAPDQSFEFHEGHGVLLDSLFRLDVEPVVNPVSPRSKQVRQPRQRRAGSEILSDAWWDAPVDISRWDGLTGKALYSAMLDEFNALLNGLSVIE